MAAWTKPTPSTFYDCHVIVGSLSGGALSTENDPNTTAPDVSRVSFTPKSALRQILCSLQADAGCVVEGWWYSYTIGRWFRVNQTTLVADITTAIGAGISSIGIPENVPFFLRVQANAGGAKVVSAMFH